MIRQFKGNGMKSVIGRGLLALVLAVPSLALADDPAGPGFVNQSIIEGQALGNFSGLFALNMAAGDANQQANARAIAVNLQGGASSASVIILQSLQDFHGTAPSRAVTRIEGQAFNNASGAIAINQASGVANLQSNGLVIVLGIQGEAIGDSLLAESRSSISGLVLTGKSSDVRVVSVDDTAFRGARGLVQLNQSAGSGNISANQFALHFSLDAKP